jgi:hypothetical protein
MIDLSLIQKPACKLKRAVLLLLLGLFGISGLNAQTLPGFTASGLFDEQQMVIEDSPPGTRILINAPMKGFENNNRVLLVIYALPNGNSIEQTYGKNIEEGDDWHFNIQHIGAQTRFLRNILKDRTIVLVFKTAGKAGLWNSATPDYRSR